MPLDNPALRSASVVLLRATVRQAVPLMLELDGIDRAADRAAGCLVAPEIGDEVLALDLPETCLVLQVLTRPSGGGVALTHEAGIELRAPVLALHAGRALDIRAPAAAVEVDGLSLRAATATVVLRSASVLAGVLRTVAERIEQVAEHLTSRATQRTSVVEGLDVLETRAAQTRVETTLTLQAGAAVVTADTDIRMDAERISLG